MPTQKKEKNLTLEYIQNMGKSFAISATSSAIGATAVFPVDTVKTRLQNQRSNLLKTGIETSPKDVLYKNAFDCFVQVIKNEGFFQLYRGILPYLSGQVPEKAMRLFVVDRTRQKINRITSKEDGFFSKLSSKKKKIINETVAGAVAGTCQVLITNPAEIVKIRMQVAQKTSNENISAIQTLKKLGFSRMYQGASACFLRDIPFSATYFPIYWIVKDHLTGEKDIKTATPFDLLLAASFSGVIAASITTPADVIKTRMQAGKEKKGLIKTAFNILKNEGWKAFWKGVGPRVFRSSPQYAVMLVSYELLLRFAFPSHPSPSFLFDNTIFEDRWLIQKKWDPPENFTNNIKNLRKVSIGASGTVWGINPQNKAVQWNGISWLTIENSPKFQSISVGADGSTWAVGEDGSVFVWDPWKRVFVRQSNPENNLPMESISVGNQSKIWGITNNHQTWKWSHKHLSWKLQSVTPEMQKVSVGSDGTTIGITPNGNPYLWDSIENSWVSISDGITEEMLSVSAGNMKSIWGTDGTGDLWRFELRPKEWNGTWVKIDQDDTEDFTIVSAASDGTVVGLRDLRFKRKKKQRKYLKTFRREDL